MMKSIWDNIELTKYPKLNKDINCDVLIIGGGICGILCGYYLAKKEYSVVIVEADTIASKKTLKTTATLTALQDVNYYDLINRLGSKGASLYYKANMDAIEDYKKLNEIYDFDFDIVSSYKYFNDDIDSFHKEIKALNDIKCNYNTIDFMELNNVTNVIEFKNQAQINPLKLIASLSKDLTIYEKTKIINIHKLVAYTSDYNKISAKKIIVATGYPFLRFNGGFYLKMYQKKSYVIAIKNNTHFKGNMIGSNSKNLYFRNYKDYLIVGGNDQKTGDNILGFKPLIDYVGNAKIINAWVNQDCMSLDYLPYIGKYGNENSVFVATGFNMWGMTSAMISAKLLTDMIDNKDNEYSQLFNPKRAMLIKPLLGNIINAISGFFRFKVKRCNHLGCALFYNKEENVFECPCHGSKFDINGNVIDGPSNNKL